MELDTLLEISSRLGLLNRSMAEALEREIVELLRMITVFQRKLTPFAGYQDDSP